MNFEFPFVSTVTPPADWRGRAFWFLFRGDKLLVQEGETSAVPFVADPQAEGWPVASGHYLGYWNEPTAVHCYTASWPEDVPAPEGMTFTGLRGLYFRVPSFLFWTAGRAVQIVEWERTHRFCGRCGTATELAPGERAKKCPQCGLTVYPRLAPAVIVAIVRTTPEGKKLLLARNNRYPTGMFSVLAGFVEPGEDLETCVHREIAEEVNIQVTNIRYFGSQPWPFPHSLMIAFTAEYAGGEIQVDANELDEAQWFGADEMPQIPPSLSISRALIDWFVAENKPN